MWKRYFIIPIVIFISPVIGSKRKKSDSIDCQRTNQEAFRYCEKSCSSDSDCKSNHKCLCDGDCGMSCVRNNLRCEALSKSKNSRQEVSDGRSFNSVVTYTCKPPFKLRGSSTRTCRAIGKWDGKKARCRIACKDPGEISSGNRRTEGLQAGKYIQYWCFESYNLVGSARIMCLETGEWSAPKPKCELPQCDPPKIPDSAIMYYPRKMKKSFKYSDRVLLKCKEGYFKTRGGVLQCKGTNQWSGDITCSPKSCGRPRDVPNGKIIGYLYSFKEKVRYVCNEGFKLNGPAYRICQANEEWGGSTPTCEVVGCGPLDKPDHGEIIEQVGLTFGNRIVFQCKDKGYEMKGSRVRTCQSDGTWSGPPTTCEIVQCGDPGTPANGGKLVKKGFVYGGSVEFNCDKNYTLTGTSTIYCQESKEWTSSVPRCLAPCPDPGLPYQGNRIGNDFRHDKTVIFTCPRDYLMEGLPTMKCSDGRWSVNSKPSCKAPCAKLAPPAHGSKSGEGFRHRASVMFYCTRGYTRVGASPITCNDGKWNNPSPVCKGICPRPRTPNKGRLHGNRARFIDGDEVTYSCDSNHDLFGNDRIRCVGKNWDSSVPDCKARCSFSRRPEGGLYVEGTIKKNAMIKHGEKITFGCLGDYTMIGSNTKECNNGFWTNDDPVCKVFCQPPGDIFHGTKNGTDYRHGRTVWYQCNAGYTLKGSDRLTCNDGRWNLDPPECKAPCIKPGTPFNGKMRGDDFKHDSWVIFTCNRNYQLDGSKNMHCNDGLWSGSVPNCVPVCPDPGEPSKGKRLSENFQEGKTVTFKCNRDHDLVGNDTIRCEGGMWSGDVPKCKARCAFHGNPDNGYTTNGNFRMAELLPDGTNVEYACNVPYTLVGPSIQYCDDGSWDTSRPSCKASCQDPGFLENGRKTGNDFSHGQIVTYECTTQGYSLVGTPQLTCNDGRWDSKGPECKASCDPLPALFNGEVNSRDRNHGALVSFSCKKGFQLKGSKQILCIDGTWNASSPTCEGFCTDPGLFDNGKVIGNDYSYNSLIRFQCNFGYDLLGPASLTCKKGIWDGRIPVCKKRCKDPGNPRNGWKIGMNHSHGGSVQFVCKSRSLDLFGASKITCDEGKWSHPTPSCEARCSDPGMPDNGTKDGDNYRSRANVTFRCNPPLELIGRRKIFCQDGKWSDSRPTCSNCARPLGLEDNKNQIRSPASLTDPFYPPNAARLNGPSTWCPLRTPAYLQIDLDKSYKLTAIATQGGGTVRDKWVRGYTIRFGAGKYIVDYIESGSRKNIPGNKDATSLVKYKFKEPFITSVVRIQPSSSPNDAICLRMELYGCDPNPDCILVGSMFWGLWSYKHGANNYYKAYITKLTATHLDFVLQLGANYKRSYQRTEQVLILDTIPTIKDISINSKVIARQHRHLPNRYRSGIVTGFPSAASASVKFDDGETHKVLLKYLRLVKRPRFCVNDI